MAFELITGRVAQMITLILILAVTLYVLEMGKRKKSWNLRRISGIDAIEKAVEYAAELQRPVFFAPGIGQLSSQDGMQTVAGVTYLDYVARLCARHSTPIIVMSNIAELFPVIEQILRSSFAVEGKEQEFNPDYSIRIMPGQQIWQYYFAMLAMIETENVGANIQLGNLAFEILPAAEAAANIGALSVMGTSRTSNMQFLIGSSCDNAVLGEELFAGAAYVSADKTQIAAMNGQDIVKISIIVVSLIGALLLAAGFSIIPYLSS